MKLSIITICYNIKDEIERTCQSITTQTNQNFEWIVVDGGSTDGTVDILNKYKDHMTVFISEPDKGIYNAMNKGIKRARGEYLNFMNGGDCFASSDVVENFINFQAENNADIIYGNCDIVNQKGIRNPANIPANVDKLYFYNGYTINHQASFIKRELFNQYGLYNENYRIVSDWEKWIVFITNNCRFQHWQYVVGNFYLGGISSVNLELHRKEVEAVCAKYYTQEEVAQATKNIYHARKYNIKLLGFIPFLTIKYKPLSIKITCKLFGFIPLYKIKKKNNKSIHYLFSFIPLFKIKEK